MADIYMNSSSSAFTILEQARQEFWSTHAHLTEEQRQEAWSTAALYPNSNAFDISAQPSMAQQIPRTMPNSMSNLTQLPQMDRTQSAPASRPRSTTIPESIDIQRSTSDFGIWPATTSSNESTGDYALFSEHSMRVQASLQAIPETTVEYTPGDYVNTCIEASSPSVPFRNMNMQVQLTPQWCQSSDCSTSPSTPQTALMTPVTQSSNAMSRQGSLNPNFLDESSLRVQSDLSFMPILPEDSQLSFPSSCFDGSKLVDSNFLSFTGPMASEPVVFPAFSSSSSSSLPVPHASAHALASPEQQSPQNASYLAEDMRRSTSHSSESGASIVSTRSSFSRQSRREREINAAAASRPLAPKQGGELSSAHPISTSPDPSSAQLAQIRASDGSSKTVGVLHKTPYVRPSHPKIMCVHCNERPDGFRGTHELDRHIARAHAAVRKGFICVAPSFDAKFLDNCKHCRNKKVYGAYYNAAAHLRRAHFHPRKRGRKGKNDEKRGGIGGGDHPAMDWLKQHWIRELEVPNNTKAQSVSASPESAEDSAGETESAPAVFDAFEMHGVETQYPPGQHQLPAIPLDYGLSASIVAADAFPYQAPVEGFSFDAYAMGP
ncbi:hypothetical protein E8E13_001881 [Curvularia kusanoi]|uniref:DUF7896 domain-containing protein n=1 Tax=Curvularia kusanoi TaxID=90978 RepID=A0A9P4TCP0_CURKU|nr:hypothetical protein E8E13_001881 [Curvularia kusanoi]